MRDEGGEDRGVGPVDEVGSVNFDEENLRAEFAGQRSRLDKLRAEVLSILQDAVSHSGIKVSTYEDRTKEIDSLLKKCKHKDYATLSDVNDAVGLRIVSLFRADLAPIGDIIGKYFHVVSIDDKVISSVDEFGYMSVHYVCQLPSSYSGPRYDDIKGLHFEIQVRTVAMHAWAAISHAIDYKNEADVPIELRKSFNALSALFFLADTQFEIFAKEAQLSRAKAEKIITSPNTNRAVPLDFDTLSAFTARQYPDRTLGSNDHVSGLLSELLEAGISTVEALSKYFTVTPPLVERYEQFIKSKPKHFSRVGAVRVTLRALSSKYRSAREKILRKEGQRLSRSYLRKVDEFKAAFNLADID